MKSKNEKGTSKNESTQQQSKSTNKKGTATNTGTSRATDNVKAKAGRGSANEGTNVSYEEER